MAVLVAMGLAGGPWPALAQGGGLGQERETERREERGERREEKEERREERGEEIRPAEKSPAEVLRGAMDRLEMLDAPALTMTDAVFRETLQEVQQALVSLQARDAANPWLHYLAGRYYGLSGRSGDAIDHLQKFVDTREGRNEWRAYRALGDLFVDQFPRLAKSNYEKAAGLKRDEASVLFGLSQCAAKLGDSEEAYRLAREAARADGRRTLRYLNHLARIAERLQQWSEAESAAVAGLSLAEEAVRANPGRRGPLVVLDGQYQLVADVIRKHVASVKDASVAARELLRLADYARERVEVVALIARHDVVQPLRLAAQRTAPDTPIALLEQLGMALTEVQQVAEARAIFEEILQRDPTNAVAPTWLERLE